MALLDRNTKPLKPTASGLRVYEQCRRVLREVDGLRELVAGDATPSGVLRLGVPQSIGEVVLLDALRRLADEYPELRAQVGTGWGSHLLARLENAELDAAVVLFPPSKVFPEELGATPLGRMELCVVVARDSAIQARRLLDCYHHGWVLNPDGCGFRAGLQRALADQGLGLQLNLGLSAASCNWAWSPRAGVSAWCRRRPWRVAATAISCRCCNWRISSR